MSVTSNDLEMLPTHDLFIQLRALRRFLLGLERDDPEMQALYNAGRAEMKKRKREAAYVRVALEFKVDTGNDWSQNFVVHQDRDDRYHLFRKVPSGPLHLGQAPFVSPEDAERWASMMVRSNGPFPD